MLFTLTRQRRVFVFIQAGTIAAGRFLQCALYSPFYRQQHKIYLYECYLHRGTLQDIPAI